MEQAVGRLVGALCVVTGKDEDAESAMLASWVSQVRAMPACSSHKSAYDRHRSVYYRHTKFVGCKVIWLNR